MNQPRPRSVTGAIWLLVALVAITGLAALLTVLFKDQLIDSWASGRADAGAVEPPAFVPVSVVMFIVIAAVAAVLLQFFRYGYNWARIALTVLAACMAVATLAGLRTDPPLIFWVASVVALLLDLALVACLWHKDTRAFVAERPVEVGSPS